jgi:hypothetical protein
MKTFEYLNHSVTFKYYKANYPGRMNIKFSLGKCKTKATYAAKLATAKLLDLQAIEKKFKVDFSTSVMLKLKIDDIEVLVHKHGEILFKNSSDMDKMEKIANKIYLVGLD